MCDGCLCVSARHLGLVRAGELVAVAAGVMDKWIWSGNGVGTVPDL